MKNKFILLALLVQFLVWPVLRTEAAEVRVSIAASMTDVFKEINHAFTDEHPWVTIQSNFGSSGSLAKQIVQGAPVDLYVSANPNWMTYLERAGSIRPETVHVFSTNTLVLVGFASKTISSLHDLINMKRVAIGSPSSVPAGRYAEQAMRAKGVYEALLAEKKFVMAKDVRQALLYADRGEVDCSIVYKTDALLLKNAVILYSIPSHLHNSISYSFGLTLSGAKNVDARVYSEYLKSLESMKILKKYGFVVSREDAPGDAG